MTLMRTPRLARALAIAAVSSLATLGSSASLFAQDTTQPAASLTQQRQQPSQQEPAQKEPAAISAQRKPANPPPSTQRQGSQPSKFGFSGFVEFGQTSFAAKDSFDAILDTSSGPIFGGGGQVNLPLNLFARVDVTRFKKDGERAFVSNGEVFKLGIPTTIEVMPIEITAGYRRELTFGRRGAGPGSSGRGGRGNRGFRLIPFVGGGAGVVQYKETADFAGAGDDVDESFTSYHFMGGVEVPLWKFIGVGAEYHHRWVPDALGEGGVSAEFNETDLGGGTFRFRVIFGF
jgi:opacity protein-like surface antigen